MLGDAAFESLHELMEHRKSVTRALSAAIARYKELYGGGAVLGDMGGTAGAGAGGSASSSMPVYGTTVTITSSSQKLLAKLQRKDAKKQGSKGKSDAEVEVEWLMQAGMRALMDIEAPPAAAANTILLAGGVELRIGSGEGQAGGAA
ncbi:hypothetical protein Agub_g280, partial [Astrephomene gubernaculifera]